MNMKPNQLGMIIVDEAIENIGKIGEVICFYNQHSTGNPAWEMTFPTAIKCDDGAYSVYVGIEDKNLRPVSGLPLQEEEETDIKVPA